MVAIKEQDRRLDLLNTLLTTPHRQLDLVQPVHAEMVQADPRFYVRLAAWYSDHGDVRAQKVLFDEQPPEGSRLHALKLLARAETPEEQARIVREQQLPYRVAATVVPKPAPLVVQALIESMSPQELINSLGALKRRGALD